HTWELRGVYPKILNHEKYGEQARKIFADANVMLDRFIAEKLITACGIYGFFPANRTGDDIIVWTDDTRTTERTRLHHLRQQVAKDDGTPYRCIADFVAPVADDVNRRTDREDGKSARALTSAATDDIAPTPNASQHPADYIAAFSRASSMLTSFAALPAWCWRSAS
ncbi:MAG: vitamin B12 dependent-methionine synthase activation domain-containing protein, partial [Chthoniobacteraceae bacterium]